MPKISIQNISYPVQIKNTSSVSLTWTWYNFDITSLWHKLAIIFQIPITGTMTWAQFWIYSFTTQWDAPISIRLETIDASWNPSWTLYNANATTTINPITTWIQDCTWGTPFSVNAWDFVAIVISDVSVTTSWDFTMTVASSWNGASLPIWAYSKTPGAWTTSGTNSRPAFICKYGAISYSVSWASATILDTEKTFDQWTTPDEVWILFTMPFGCTANAAYMLCDYNIDSDIILYDSVNNILATQSVTANVAYAPWWINNIIFPSQVPLEKGASYRLVVRPQDTWNDSRLWCHVFPDTQSRWAQFDGQTIQMTERTDTWAWTETSLTIPHMWLWITEIDIPLSVATQHSYIW